MLYIYNRKVGTLHVTYFKNILDLYLDQFIAFIFLLKPLHKIFKEM